MCTPIANWVIIAVTSFISIGAIFGGYESWAYGLILNGWNPLGILGHVFLHADLPHLFGNMIYLWVFGNAICGNTNNKLFPLLYFGFGVFAAFTHNIMDGSPAVGASGAVNGIVGIATAMYPKNNVSLFYFLIIKAGTFELRLWVLSLLWLALDVFDVLTGDSGVAVWAHIGGFFAGLILGVVFLRTGIVKLTEWDNPSLSDWLAEK